METGLEYSY